ncbi:hypothetical protein VSS37_06665 [Candidatus Thiothrix sp. Deng01]|uniref:Uncharacterized protein n=1 Tax=Candidatus Thiothrix phosphatis TaxID=3112415 RepID=A0ABU6CV45_9GAMM|nr:hypothetical protein [Candidatus Thiothrix sp. Deng01]MEB4590654.1 hypothetical protein [Candidatus Thiothrix sp. Deng01]
MRVSGILIVISLLSGCQDKPKPQLAVELPPTRPVATIYQVAISIGAAPCYQKPQADSQLITLLQDKQLVDLASLEEGTVKTGQEYWLQIHPRFGSFPGCYVNTDNLVPIS